MGEKLIEEMKPHEQRMVAELEELESRIGKLSDFINHSEAFHYLESMDQELLTRQVTIMNDYRFILRTRISRI